MADGGILIDKDGDKICWAYLIELQKLQEKEGLRLGNKLKLSHIQWWQQKMKVNLAAQTFSASVADAIDYCRDTLKRHSSRVQKLQTSLLEHLTIYLKYSTPGTPVPKVLKLLFAKVTNLLGNLF